MKHKFNVGDVVEVINARYNSYGKSCIVKEFRHTFNPCFEVEYLLHTGEVVYGDVDLQLITKTKKSWKENKSMEEIKRSTPKFKRGDKVKVMRDEVFTVDEVVTTESKHGITHEYFVDDDMDLLQENELILVEDVESETQLKVKPKELLKNGIFVLRNGIWYIVVDTLFVGEDGDYSTLEDYDDNLYYKWDFNYHFDAIVEAKSFALAKNKYKNGEVVWKRTT